MTGRKVEKGKRGKGKEGGRFLDDGSTGLPACTVQTKMAGETSALITVQKEKGPGATLSALKNRIESPFRFLCYEFSRCICKDFRADK
jgi:hypothetical protein